MAGVSPQDGQPLTNTLARAFRVGRIEFITGDHNMGLSAETATEWVRGCVSEKQLRQVAAAIDARLAALVAKEKAKAAKRAKAK